MGEPYPSSERERKILRRVFTSSIKRHTRTWSCSEDKEMNQKVRCTCKVVVLLI